MFENIKQKRRKEIMAKEYPLEQNILSIIFLILSIFIFYIYYKNNIKDYENIINILKSEETFAIIISTAFFIIALYYWIDFFINIIKKPKTDILYLKEKTTKTYTFIDKKGRTYTFNEGYYELNQYYYVKKTHDYIYEIISECQEKEKYYNIPKKEKNKIDTGYIIFCYIMLITGIFLIFHKPLMGLLMVCIMLFQIADYYFKNKKIKKLYSKFIDTVAKFIDAVANMYNFITSKIYIIINIILLLAIIIFIENLITGPTDIETKFMLSPFFFGIFFALSANILKYFNKEKYAKACIITTISMLILYTITMLIIGIIKIN